MANVFNIAEIVDMGIEKEKRRRDFYAQVADHFKEKELKELFAQLSNWEEMHVEKFTQIRNSIDEVETTESSVGEIASYMNALVEEELYKDTLPGNFAKKITTPLSAIQYAMGFEKDAIMFFSNLLKFLDSHNKEAVVKLIDEEKQHLVYLYQLKVKISR